MAHSKLAKAHSFPVKNVWSHERKKYDRVHEAWCFGCRQPGYLTVKNRAGMLPISVCEKKFASIGWKIGPNRKRDLCPQCVQAEQKGAEIIQFNREPTIESVFGNAPIPPKDRPPTPRELALKLSKELRETDRPKKAPSAPTDEWLATLGEAATAASDLDRQAKRMNAIAERMVDETSDLNTQASTITMKVLELIDTLPEAIREKEKLDAMAFKLLSGTLGGGKSTVKPRSCRLAIVTSGKATPPITTGRVIFGPELISELGWMAGDEMEIHQGEQEDAGKFLIRPGKKPDACCTLGVHSKKIKSAIITSRNGFGDYEQLKPREVSFSVKKPTKKDRGGLILEMPLEAKLKPEPEEK